jgi:dynein heavy chain
VITGKLNPITIENLNSVLDDNKRLILANGENIPMCPNTRIVFVDNDADNKSPATISRLGIIYME